MQVPRLAAIICLLTTLSLAQNVIDTRDKAYREISGHQAHGGGSAGDHKYLNVPIAIPQALDWNEIDQGRASQNFVRATLSVHMGCLEHDE